MTKQSQQLLLMLVIGILIGTAGVMAWKSHQTNGDDIVGSNTTASGATNAEGVMTSTTTTIQAIPSLPAAPQIPKNIRVGISVDDQSAGQTVSVTGLSLTETQWIAVYDDREGHPGWIMGAVRAHPGDTSTEVELLRPLSSGQTYYVAILNDDGGDTFNRLTDLPPMTPDKVVIVSFVAK